MTMLDTGPELVVRVKDTYETMGSCMSLTMEMVIHIKISQKSDALVEELRSIAHFLKIEATHMPFNGWWYIHSVKYYSAIKKDGNTETHNHLDESQVHMWSG